jgi:hypothetical protein
MYRPPLSCPSPWVAVFIPWLMAFKVVVSVSCSHLLLCNISQANSHGVSSILASLSCPCLSFITNPLSLSCRCLGLGNSSTSLFPAIFFFFSFCRLHIGITGSSASSACGNYSQTSTIGPLVVTCESRIGSLEVTIITPGFSTSFTPPSESTTL